MIASLGTTRVLSQFKDGSREYFGVGSGDLQTWEFFEDDDMDKCLSLLVKSSTLMFAIIWTDSNEA